MPIADALTSTGVVCGLGESSGEQARPGNPALLNRHLLRTVPPLANRFAGKVNNGVKSFQCPASKCLLRDPRRHHCWPSGKTRHYAHDRDPTGRNVVRAVPTIPVCPGNSNACVFWLVVLASEARTHDASEARPEYTFPATDVIRDRREDVTSDVHC